MTIRVALADELAVADAGFKVTREYGGWTLRDPDGDCLMIGSHGCVAPTKAAAVVEGLHRIEMDVAA